MTTTVSRQAIRLASDADAHTRVTHRHSMRALIYITPHGLEYRSTTR